jgi:hypothetical protein
VRRIADNDALGGKGLALGAFEALVTLRLLDKLLENMTTLRALVSFDDEHLFPR